MALIKVTYVCPDCKDVMYSQFEKLDDKPQKWREPGEDRRTDDRLCEPCSEAEVLSFNQFYEGY